MTLLLRLCWAGWYPDVPLYCQCGTAPICTRGSSNVCLPTQGCQSRLPACPLADKQPVRPASWLTGWFAAPCMCLFCAVQGQAAGQQLVERAHQYMIRRTSETLKQYLPAKIQEVGAGLCGCLDG